MNVTRLEDIQGANENALKFDRKGRNILAKAIREQVIMNLNILKES